MFKREGLIIIQFRLGEIEHLPVADASVDVIFSNRVINLSPDKPQVFREAGFMDVHIAPKDTSRAFIRDWAPGRSVED